MSTTVSPTAGQQADRPVGDDEPAESIPDCPHLRVIELFGRILPALPQPKPELWSGTKATHMRARWAWLLTAKRRSGERYAVNEEDAMDWLRRLFEHVAESDFLMGRTQVNFSCSLEWLVNAANFSKVVQGNYTNKEKP